MKENIIELIGLLFAIFFWSVALYLGYRWVSCNFNLPAASYFDICSLYASMKVIGGILRNIIHNGKEN